MVRRTRLIELLQSASGAHAICLQAPGGYGKTTVLTQWLEGDERPSVWLNIRPEAPDAGWLAQSLLDGLVAVGLLGERTNLPLSVDTISWVLGVLPTVERALGSIQVPFIVVIDDAGELYGTQWESLLTSLLNGMPAGAQLVLASRAAIPKPLRRLRAQGELLAVGPEQLAFDAHEVRELMPMPGVPVPVAEATVASLLQQTEGWPVALYLAVAWQGGLSKADRHKGLMSNEALSDYLRDEILERLAADDARFLLRTSVLTTLDGPACDVLTGTHASLRRLRSLAAANNLLTPVGGDRFRMHALLRSFLNEELRATEPDVWRACHATASMVRERQGDLDAAAYHARLAGDDSRLGALLWRHAGRALATSHAAVLRRWMAGLPDNRITRVGELSLCAAWLASHEGDPIRMTRMATIAVAICDQAGPPLSLDAGLLQATIGHDGLPAIEAAADAFIAGRPPDNDWMTLAHFLKGIALTLLGDSEGGLASFERGYRLARALELSVMEAHCLTAMADVWLASQEPRRALPLIRQARAIIATFRLELIATTAPVFTTSAAGYLAEGRPTEARREAMRALRQTSMVQTILPWFAVQGRVTLAEVFLALGDVSRANALLDEADAERGAATRSPVLDEAFARARDGARRAGTPIPGSAVLTAAEVRVLQYLPTHLSLPAIAAELNVSPHTVKSQALSAYRKLGVHNRDDAIRHARQVGLLP